jgi:hypothetical protein
LFVFANSRRRDVPTDGIGIKSDGCRFKPRYEAIHRLEDVSAIVLDRPVDITARPVLRQSIAKILIRLIQSLNAFVHRNQFVYLVVTENERQSILPKCGFLSCSTPIIAVNAQPFDPPASGQQEPNDIKPRRGR